MDTSLYLYLGYSFFWLLPTFYLMTLVRKIVRVEERLEKLQDSKGEGGGLK